MVYEIVFKKRFQNNIYELFPGSIKREREKNGIAKKAAKFFLILVLPNMKFVTLAITLFVIQSIFAQDSSRVFLPAGTTMPQITPSVKYRFPQFKQGKVLLYDNSVYEVRLNYNYFNGEVMFIDPAGDTLAIANDLMLNLKRVTIDTTSFLYNKGYKQVVLENASGSLLKKQQYKMVSKEKMGAYNMGSEADAVDSYSSFVDSRNRSHTLAIRENITLQLNTDYFVGDQFKLVLPVNRRNLEKIFFKKKNELEKYLKEHVVDFKNENDLKAMFIAVTDN
jgi:hypothetical protein